mmetsp:Transcript_88987/g.288200  ORF Transcript_88987/g.288200 Transcript_88987/m.288200 type:complete len:246 (-) Transcript_88987:340-1077(-)
MAAVSNEVSTEAENKRYELGTGVGLRFPWIPRMVVQAAQHCGDRVISLVRCQDGDAVVGDAELMERLRAVPEVLRQGHQALGPGPVGVQVQAPQTHVELPQTLEDARDAHVAEAVPRQVQSAEPPRLPVLTQKPGLQAEEQVVDMVVQAHPIAKRDLHAVQAVFDALQKGAVRLRLLLCVVPAARGTVGPSACKRSRRANTPPGARGHMCRGEAAAFIVAVVPREGLGALRMVRGRRVLVAVSAR